MLGFQRRTDLAKLVLQFSANRPSDPALHNAVPKLLLQLRFREATDIVCEIPHFPFLRPVYRVLPGFLHLLVSLLRYVITELNCPLSTLI